MSWLKLFRASTIGAEGPLKNGGKEANQDQNLGSNFSYIGKPSVIGALTSI